MGRQRFYSSNLYTCLHSLIVNNFPNLSLFSQTWSTGRCNVPPEDPAAAGDGRQGLTGRTAPRPRGRRGSAFLRCPRSPSFPWAAATSSSRSDAKQNRRAKRLSLGCVNFRDFTDPLCSQNFDCIMASPTPPSGSLSGFIDDGNNAGAEDVSGNVGLSPRPPGLMYADLQVCTCIGLG